jgi:hypothetical protein
MTTNGEFGRKWKEKIVAYFMALSGGAEEKYEKRTEDNRFMVRIRIQEPQI